MSIGLIALLDNIAAIAKVAPLMMWLARGKGRNAIGGIKEMIRDAVKGK